MDAVVAEVLPCAGQHFFAFNGAEAKIAGNTLSGTCTRCSPLAARGRTLSVNA